jgi:hypothetical protein
LSAQADQLAVRGRIARSRVANTSSFTRTTRSHDPGSQIYYRLIADRSVADFVPGEQLIAVGSQDVMAILGVVALLYLAITIPAGLAAHHFEHNLAVQR